jgi:hypothetical protein
VIDRVSRSWASIDAAAAEAVVGLAVAAAARAAALLLLAAAKRDGRLAAAPAAIGRCVRGVDVADAASEKAHSMEVRSAATDRTEHKPLDSAADGGGGRARCNSMSTSAKHPSIKSVLPDSDHASSPSTK